MPPLETGKEAGHLPGAIAVLIPEYPGQTHSFFWREITALQEHHGIRARVVSTRLPRGPVLHEWVKEVDAFQLYPIPAAEAAVLASRLAAALPRLLGDQDMRRILRRPKGWACALLAARLAQICRRHGLTHMHVHSCANFALIAAICNRMSGIPYSLALHGPLSYYGSEQAFKWKHAEFVFVVTEQLRAEAENLLPSQAEKLRVVPMGVDTAVFAPPPVPRPERPSPFTWFSCARLNRGKGHGTVLAAAAELRRRQPGLNFRIRIAGEDEQGGAGYRRELEDQIDTAGMTDRVQLLGAITQDQVRQELQAADGFVLASHAEAIGVAYMEAMSCGLPVIGTDVGGVGELITDGHDGVLVPPGDPQALAAAMARIMEMAPLRQSLGAAARQTIRRDFESRRSADALVAALRELAASKALRPVRGHAAMRRS